jgi:SAM-dependent methyltransferase
MNSQENHKKLMREIYRYPKCSYAELELKRRTSRVEKFAPIFNERLRKGIIVDLGCGMGTYSKEINSRMIIGLDFSIEGLAIAKDYCPFGSFICGDLEHLPFKEKSINAFFSFCSIYCLTLPSQYKLFEELFRTLKENGNIILVEPNDLNPFKEKWPKQPLNKNRVEKCLKEIGFKNVEVKFCNFIPRFVAKRGSGPVFSIFKGLERILEYLRIPFAGAIMVYAEK